jgi:hypothetical protein
MAAKAKTNIEATATGSKNTESLGAGRRSRPRRLRSLEAIEV